ncbi:hypothetical protein DND47_29960, partial [Pseudomonas syringae pv. syringae]
VLKRLLQNMRKIKIDCFSILVWLAMSSLQNKWDPIEKFESVVVDREEDVYQVTEELYRLHNKRKQLKGQSTDLSYRLTIPFAPHMFGSGKSTFCVGYLELVRRFGETSLASFASDPSMGSFLDKLKSSAFLYVDMRGLEPTDPKERNLKWAVYYLMIKTACLQVGTPVMQKRQAYETVEMESSNLIALLRDKLNIPADQYLLVAFDEVGILDESYGDFDFKKNDEGRVRPYNDFFGIVRQLCLEDNLFVIVVGKSKGLSIKNSVA